MVDGKECLLSMRDRIFQEYPIPQALSIWGTSSNDAAQVDLDKLIAFTVDDLASDLSVYDTIQATGINTRMPEDTLAVTAVKLTLPFQGNRYVKFTYDVHSKVCCVRYIPSVISYKRKLHLSDLGVLVKGARLQYVKSAILVRMAQKEISYLTTVNLETDAGGINLDALREFRDQQSEIVKELHEDVLLYSNS